MGLHKCRCDGKGLIMNNKRCPCQLRKFQEFKGSVSRTYTKAKYIFFFYCYLLVGCGPWIKSTSHHVYY